MLISRFTWLEVPSVENYLTRMIGLKMKQTGDYCWLSSWMLSWVIFEDCLLLTVVKLPSGFRRHHLPHAYHSYPSKRSNHFLRLLDLPFQNYMSRGCCDFLLLIEELFCGAALTLIFFLGISRIWTKICWIIKSKIKLIRLYLSCIINSSNVYGLPERQLFLRNCWLYCFYKARSTNSNVCTWKSLHCSLVSCANDASLFWASWGLKLDFIEFLY